MQISRYAAARAADNGVAFPDLLNTKADEGQLQHTKLCLLSSLQKQTAWYWIGSRHMSNDIIVANVNYRFR